MAVNRVTIEEARRLLDHEGYRYVDVRTEIEFLAGHPAGAYNVPYPNDEFIVVMRALFAAGDNLVIGCQSGQRSLRAAEALLAAGFRGVVEMRAGYGGVRNAFGQLKEPGWAAAGLPIATDSEGKSYEELKAKSTTR